MAGQVTLRGRFSAGTVVRLVRVAHEGVLRPEGGEEVDVQTAEKDENGVASVSFKSGVDEGARYIATGISDGRPLDVRVRGRSADDPSEILEQPPIQPDRVRLTDGSWSDQAPTKESAPKLAFTAPGAASGAGRGDAALGHAAGVGASGGRGVRGACPPAGVGQGGHAADVRHPAQGGRWRPGRRGRGGDGDRARPAAPGGRARWRVAALGHADGCRSAVAGRGHGQGPAGPRLLEDPGEPGRQHARGGGAVGCEGREARAAEGREREAVARAPGGVSGGEDRAEGSRSAGGRAGESVGPGRDGPAGLPDVAAAAGVESADAPGDPYDSGPDPARVEAGRKAARTRARNAEENAAKDE
jgi:hypothetical protein